MKPLRDLQYSQWSDRVRASRFVSAPITLGRTEGREGLLCVDRVTEPLRVFNGSEMMTIIDKGYSWYALALRDRFVWMHACFAPEGELVEVYFDVTAGNRFDDPENPCFADMYLDVVITPAGALRVLDRDELDAALEARQITRKAHEAAILHCEALVRDLEQHRFDVLHFCKGHRLALLDELKRRETL